MKTLVYKWFIKKFLKIFHHDDIIVLKKDGSILIGGKKISDQKLKSLREDAQLLKNTALLQLVLRTIRTHAENQIMYNGTNMEIVHNNRMVIYTVGQIEQMIYLFNEYDKVMDKRNQYLATIWDQNSV